MEISFAELVSILIKRIKLISIGTLLGLFLFYALNKYLIDPFYTASVQLYVSSTEGTDAASDLNSLNYAQKVVNTYINFLQTQTFYSRVSNESGLNYTADQIKYMTKIKSVNNTEIFSISVTTNDANDTYILVSTMQKIAPELIREIKGEGATICVVDSAVFPIGPAGPNIKMNTLIGGILGLFMAAMASIAWEILNNNVKNQDELKRKYDKPVLGVIPDFHPIHKKAILTFKGTPIIRIPQKFSYLKDKKSDEIRFLCIEAYNSLRSNLRFLLRNEGCKKIIISSPNSSEGKSTTSVNLAIAIAQTGSRVLLLDCDLRMGTLHNFFQLSSMPGISDVLSKAVNEAEVLQSTKYSNLEIITMGMIPPNPAELLGSTQMEEFIKQLEKRFDYILFDTPPVNLVSDLFGLTRLADGIILVVKEQVTTHSDVMEALNKYELAQANLLGFVLNGYHYELDGKKKYQYNYRISEKND